VLVPGLIADVLVLVAALRADPVGDGISRTAEPDATAALPVIPVTAGVPAAGSGAAPDFRDARDRVVRRSPGPSFGLITRAYVSLIGSPRSAV